MRTHTEELLSRIFFRALRETRDLDKASLIVMGDYLGGSEENKIELAMKLYKLKMSECLRISAFLEKRSNEL